MNLFKFFPNKNLKWYFKLFLKLQEYISILTVWKENGLKLDNSENFKPNRLFFYDKAFFTNGISFVLLLVEIFKSDLCQLQEPLELSNSFNQITWTYI